MGEFILLHFGKAWSFAPDFAKFPNKNRPSSQMKSRQIPKQKSAKFPNGKMDNFVIY